MIQINYTNYWYGKVQYWLPYSVGRLIAQAVRVPEIRDNYNFKMFFKREDPVTIVDQLEDPVLVGLSMYTWNVRYQTKLAKLIKERYPKCVIVFGGPSAVQDHLDQGLCDIYVNGEGEYHFTNIMLKLHHGEEFQDLYDTQRITELAHLASPYVDGIFDDIVAENPDSKWLVTFETDRGCPYQCTFCDWGGLTQSKIRKYGLELIFKEIDWMRDNNVAYIFGGNANFGVFPERDLLIAKYLHDASEHPNAIFDSVNMQYLKNNTEVAMQIEAILGEKLTKGITLSKQSDNPDVLKAIKRKNLDDIKFHNQVKMGESYNVITYTEFILPLPLETLETFRQGLTSCLENDQHTSIDIWPAALLPKAEMDNAETHEKYGFEWIECDDFAKNNLQINDYDDADTEEKARVIVATNTMDKHDVIEAYMFGWFMIRLHFCGYSQLVSRYLNNKHQVSYLDFYMRFQEKFRNHALFKEAYNHMQDYIQCFVHHGKCDPITADPRLQPRMGMHFVTGMARTYCYDYKEEIFDLVFEVAQEFHELPAELVDMQRIFVFDENLSYPQKFTLDYDIVNNVDEPTEYTIQDKIRKFAKVSLNDETLSEDNMGMILRRQGYRCFMKVDRETEYSIDPQQRIQEALWRAEIKLLEKEGIDMISPDNVLVNEKTDVENVHTEAEPINMDHLINELK